MRFREKIDILNYQIKDNFVIFQKKSYKIWFLSITVPIDSYNDNFIENLCFFDKKISILQVFDIKNQYIHIFFIFKNNNKDDINEIAKLFFKILNEKKNNHVINKNKDLATKFLFFSFADDLTDFSIVLDKTKKYLKLYQENDKNSFFIWNLRLNINEFSMNEYNFVRIALLSLDCKAFLISQIKKKKVTFSIIITSKNKDTIKKFQNLCQFQKINIKSKLNHIIIEDLVALILKNQLNSNETTNLYEYLSIIQNLKYKSVSIKGDNTNAEIIYRDQRINILLSILNEMKIKIDINKDYFILTNLNIILFFINESNLTEFYNYIQNNYFKIDRILLIYKDSTQKSNFEQIEMKILKKIYIYQIDDIELIKKDIIELIQIKGIKND